MSLKTVAPYATKNLSVPIGQKIAISTNGGDNVTIWYQTDAGVSPVGWYVHDVIVNEEVLLGTFTGVQGVRIETQSSPALYDIGISPAVGVGDASTLNGYAQDATATADTIALRDSNGDIQANAFESTVATGTAPLTVASITKVANLNADLLDDLNTVTASTASTVAARDASGNLTANVLISDVAIGTAPLTVTSTTVVPNLNVSSLGGLASSQFVRSDVNDTMTGILTVYNGDSGQAAPHVSGRLIVEDDTSASLNILTTSSDYGAVLFGDEGGSGRGGVLYDHSTDSLSLYAAGAEKLKVNSTGIVTISGTSATINGNTVWHAGSYIYPLQGAPTAKTTSTTLTAAEVNTGIITVNNGAAGTTTLTLPLATAMDSQFTGVAAGNSWDFYVINVSTTAAEDADVGTNTGWTLVGNMDIEADDDPRARSSAKFRARKTGAGAWTLYRVA